MTKAADLSALGSNVTTSGNLSSASTLTLQTNSTTAVTIDTSQNVGIGTTSPATKLQVVGASGSLNARINAGNTGLDITSNDATGVTDVATSPLGAGGKVMTFTTYNGSSSAERMRIASNGYVGIGTTNASNPLAVRSSANNLETGLFENTASSGNVRGILSAIGNNGNSTSSFHFAGLTQGVSFWYLYGNGTSSWTSDERKKKNIETTRDGYIDDLCKLRVVKYNWKTDEDDKPKELGLIAQEVEQVFPGLIQDALHEDIDGNTYKTIKGSVLPYMLLKAIQEQQTIINDLKAELDIVKAEIATLKGAA